MENLIKTLAGVGRHVLNKSQAAPVSYACAEARRGELRWREIATLKSGKQKKKKEEREHAKQQLRAYDRRSSNADAAVQNSLPSGGR